MAIAEVVRAKAPEGKTPPFRLERVTGVIGAAISGLDLRKSLSDDEIAAISDALVEHRVLFFRDQDITTEQHLAFARRFGPLEIHPFPEGSSTLTSSAEHPEVIILESTAKNRAAAEVWHSDVTWRAEPSLGSVLRCRIAPAYGGDTLWADMAAAYSGLDDATQAHISGLIAVHDWHGFRDGLRRRGTPEAEIAELQAKHPPPEHPVVRTHPVSGEKILYVNRAFTVQIKGMKKSESDALLERLYRQAMAAEYQVRFRWRANSVAFWDNRTTQHSVVADFYPQHRLMERVTIAGDRPF